jgi:large conductance mechanosensitive channel
MDPLKDLAGLGATKKASSLFEEFKKFAFKGNVVDLAIGVIIGGWAWHVGDKTIPYGKLLGAVVNFLLIAIVLYIFIVKFLTWVMKSRQGHADVPAPPTKDQELLMEIRDLLKQKAAEPVAPPDPAGTRRSEGA